MKKNNAILSSYGTTIFTVMSAMALKHDAINLGQGFPDQDGPEDIRAVAALAAENGPNQYPPMMGIPELRKATAKHNNSFYDLSIDWESETIVTSGATEAIAAAVFGLIEPGDEAVLIEPLYDCYLPLLQRAGAVPKLVRVEPPKWELPYSGLENAFSKNTKLLILNTPMNPAAKVYSIEELNFLAELLTKFDAYAICDEVYEHLVYSGHTHVPLMTLPKMRDRCIRISSAGKTFSMTGWKVGYSVASPNLISAMASAHQFLTFTTPPNLQEAVAFGLEKDSSYFIGLAAQMDKKRAKTAEGLSKVGFKIIDCQGTYFLTADFGPLGFKGNDVEFCEYLTKTVGVAAVPFSAFYQSSTVNQFVRFCYCKRESILDKALDKLLKHFKGA
ncbi:MAG: aminotransferase [Pseudomonadota bacterium]|nr:aminotransferase [Pseudomonadota bacterium]